MKHIVMWDWDRHNLPEKIKSILWILNCSGQTKVEYFKGRPYFAARVLGRGHPTPVHEDDEWNHVRVTYQGKDALEIFNSRFGASVRFFGENFTEAETQQIIKAFAIVEGAAWEPYLSKRRLLRRFCAFLALFFLIITFYGYISGNTVFLICYSICALGYFLVFLMI